MASAYLVMALALGASFSDDFNDGVLASQWSRYQGGGTCSETSGTLHITSTTSGNGFNGYQTTSTFDLRQGFLQVEVPNAGAQAVGWQLSLALFEGGIRQYWIIENNTAFPWAASISRPSVPFGPSTRWLRIREDNGTLHWEYGPDGVHWTTHWSEPRQFSGAAVSMTLQGGTTTPLGTVRSGDFDNFMLSEGPVTGAATAVGATTATLQGSIDPSGSATTAWFRFDTTSPVSCNDSFGVEAPAGGTALGSGSGGTPFSQVLTGLAPDTLYFFCAIVDSRFGKRLGVVRSFTTLPPAPTNPTVPDASPAPDDPVIPDAPDAGAVLLDDSPKSLRVGCGCQAADFPHVAPWLWLLAMRRRRRGR